MRLASLLTLLLALAALPASAQRLYNVTTTADEFDATPNTECSLREAVASANAPTPGSVGGCVPTVITGGRFVITVPMGTYTLALAGTEEDAGATGDLDLTQTAPVDIVGDPDGGTVIDGGAIDRILDVFPGADLTLRDLTLTNGNATGTASTRSNDGGCLYLDAAAMTMERVVVTGCASDDEGGGFRAIAGVTVTITESTFDANTADDRGGAFYAATGANTILVDRSALTNNTVGRFGGAVQVQSGSTLTIRNSTVSGNQTNDGSGFNSGGGIAAGGALIVESSTITNNAVNGQSTSNDTGGGVRCSGSQGCSFQNSVIAGNTSVDIDPDLSLASGTATSLGNNFLGIETDTFVELPSDQVGTLAVPIDPALGPLADNGGPTLSHLPQPQSSLINTGSTPLLVDQRGATRVALFDIGAVETDGIFVAAGDGPDAASAQSLGLYPNPTTGAVTLRLNAERAGTARVRIVDLQGREVLAARTVTLAGGVHEVALDASALPAGVYVVRVDSDVLVGGSRQLVVVQ